MNEMTKISLEQRAYSSAAAKASFDDGRWCNLPPMVRESIMNKLADLLEQHADELAELEAIDNGKARGESRARNA